MVEFVSLAAASPLAGLSGSAGVDAPMAREVWPFNATQIAWHGAAPQALAQALGVRALPAKACEGFVRGDDEALILPSMPGRVLRMADTPPTKACLSAVAKAGAYALDLTAGRVCLTLQGPRWRWTLMKGSGLDFEALEPGAVAQTALFKVSTLLWVLEAETVALLMPYSTARALTEKLMDAGADLAITPASAPIDRAHDRSEPANLR